MGEYISVQPAASSETVVFEVASDDYVSPRGGSHGPEELGEGSVERLAAIADLAGELISHVRLSMEPDEVELEMAVGLSGEVGWFVAKSSATGNLKLRLSWKPSNTG